MSLQHPEFQTHAVCQFAICPGSPSHLTSAGTTVIFDHSRLFENGHADLQVFANRRPPRSNYARCGACGNAYPSRSLPLRLFSHCFYYASGCFSFESILPSATSRDRVRTVLPVSGDSSSATPTQELSRLKSPLTRRRILDISRLPRKFLRMPSRSEDPLLVSTGDR
ncbi:hypothetical protein JAAARDRAFT_606970 [Jaapia argillacea MUCL 33604]|uniref:Uncharacterized protein n=1 Tax=Jaapia argillacea MUCL 33604 TaxID=933084 RepID=A0A067Q2V2_9AGAM|nr:hypothetical protein JAAARDRAFT_606970 [Jaapia argillacea MUCL 33604]